MDGSVREEAPLFPAPDYGNPDPSPAWIGIDWREHLHRVELPGASVNYVEIGEGEPSSSSTGVAGCWQNWLENLPHFGQRLPARWRSTCRASATSPMPEWQIAMAAYGRLLQRLLRRARARPGGDAGRQLDGRLRRHRGGDRGAGALRAAGAGLGGRDHQRRRPKGAAVRRPGAMVKAAAPVLRRRGRQIVCTGRGGRRIAFGRFVRYPNQLRRRAAGRAGRTRARAGDGFGRRAGGDLIGYDIRERLTEIEIPTLIVWGLSDRVVPVEAALGYHRRSPARAWRSSSAPATSRSWSARCASTRCSTSSSSRASRRRVAAGRSELARRRRLARR